MLSDSFSNIFVAVVIPAYNEEKSIANTVRDYKQHLPAAKIIVIDNASDDATARQASATLDLDCDILLHECARGKGNAIRAGVSRVDADVFIFTDGDLTYPAADAKKLLDLLLTERVDMVVGDRVSSGAYDEQNRRRLHGFGNVMVSWIVSRLARQEYHDVLSGLRVVSGPLARSVEIGSNGFQVETEFNLTAAYLRAQVREIPIRYNERQEGSSSKLKTFRDGGQILKFALSSFAAHYPVPVFAAAAAISLAVCLFWGWLAISTFLELGFMPYTPTAVAAAGFGILAVQLAISGILMGMRQAESRRQGVIRFRALKQVWNARLDANI